MLAMMSPCSLLAIHCNIWLSPVEDVLKPERVVLAHDLPTWLWSEIYGISSRAQYKMLYKILSEYFTEYSPNILSTLLFERIGFDKAFEKDERTSIQWDRNNMSYCFDLIEYSFSRLFQKLCQIISFQKKELTKYSVNIRWNILMKSFYPICFSHPFRNIHCILLKGCEKHMG